MLSYCKEETVFKPSKSGLVVEFSTTELLPLVNEHTHQFTSEYRCKKYYSTGTLDFSFCENKTKIFGLKIFGSKKINEDTNKKIGISRIIRSQIGNKTITFNQTCYFVRTKRSLPAHSTLLRYLWAWSQIIVQGVKPCQNQTLQLICEVLYSQLHRLNLYTHVHIYSHTCIHTYMHTYIHTYIYTHTYTHIHTHTHTYTHIHT